MTYSEWRKQQKQEKPKASDIPSYTYSEWRQAKDVNQDYVNTFINDYNSFFGGAQEELDGITWGTASSTYEGRKGTYDDLSARASKIRNYLKVNKNNINEKTYTDFSSMLDSLDKDGSSVLDSFKNAYDFYSQFENEDAYNDWKAAMEYDQEIKDITSMDSASIQEILDQLSERDSTASSYDAEIKKAEDAIVKALKGDYPYEGKVSSPAEALYRRNSYIDQRKADIDRLKNERDEKLAAYGDLSDIAYTTYDGKRVSWQSLYDEKVVEEATANGIAKAKADPNFASIVEKANSMTGSFSDWGIFKPGENKVAALKSNYELLSFQGLATTANVNGDYAEEAKLVKEMTQDEVNLYGYLLLTASKSEADKYYKLLVPELKKRELQSTLTQWKDIATEAPTLSSVLSIGTNLAAGGEYIADLFTGDQYNTSSAITSTIRGTVSENVDLEIAGWDAFDFVYNAGMSGVDSLVAGTMFGPTGAGVSLGLSAAAAGTNDALERGMSKGQAFWNGAAAGIFEGILEKWSLGKLDAFKDSLSIPTKSFGSFKQAFAFYGKETAKNMYKQMIVNAQEEAATEFANILYDTIVNGAIFDGDLSQAETYYRAYKEHGKSKWEAIFLTSLDLGAQIGEAAASGAFMGLGFGGLGSVSQYKNYNKPYKFDSKAIKQDFQGMEGELVSEGLSLGGKAGELASQYQDKLDQGNSLSTRQFNKLFNANDVALRNNEIAAIKSAVANRLTELGETGDIDALANTITKAAVRKAYGDTSTPEAKTIKKSQNAQRVMSELDPDSRSASWAKDLNFERFNPYQYGYTAPETDTEEKESTPSLSKAQESLDTSVKAETSTNFASATTSAAESKFEASGDGRTYNYKTGKNVSIAGVASVKDGKVTLALADGTKVNAEDIRFADEDTAMLYDMLSSIGDISDKMANALLKSYKPSDGVSADVFSRETAMGFLYGTIGNRKGLDKLHLTDIQKERAFSFGQDYAKESGRNYNNTSRKKGDITTQKAAKDGVYYDGTVIKESALTDTQKATLYGIRAIAKMSSLEIHVFESKMENGQRVAIVNGKKRTAPNGYFKDGNQIYIDINAGNLGTGVGLYALSHEITHFIAENNYEQFRALAEFLLEEYGKQDVDVDTLINREIAKLKKSYEIDGKALPSEATLYRKAFEEVVADAMSPMLADAKAYEKLAKLKAENRSLWQTIKDAVKSILDKLKAVIGTYSDLTPETLAGQEVQNFAKETFDKLQDLYLKAFVKAEANFEAKSKEGFAKVDTKSEGETVNSIRDIVGASGKNYGLGVYLDSTLLDNLTDAERIEMVKERVKELGGNTFTAYDKSGNPIAITIAEQSQWFRNKNGKKKSVNRDLTSFLGKTIKQESVVLADELIATSKFEESNPSNYSHDWLDNYGKNNWEKWTTYVQDKENAVWKATLHIANSQNGEKILYDIVPIIKVEESVTSDKPSTNPTIPQKPPVVKTQSDTTFSERDSTDSNGNTLSAEQQEFFKDSAIRVIKGDGFPKISPNGRLFPVYHGTNTGEFYKFDKKLSGSSNDAGWFGKGFYFAFSKNEAEFYGNRVLECYLNIKNPFVFDEEMFSFEGTTKGDILFDFASFVLNMADKFPNLANELTVDVAEWSDSDTSEITEKSFVEIAEEIKHIYKSNRLEYVEVHDGDSKHYEYRMKNDLDNMDISDDLKQVIRENDISSASWADYLRKNGTITIDQYDDILDAMDQYGERNFATTYLYHKFKTREEAKKYRLSTVIQYLQDKKYGYFETHIPEYYMQRIANKFSEELKRRGYDGILQSLYGDEVVAFEPEQIKLTSNKNPTSDPDIRYSERDPEMAEQQMEVLKAIEKENAKLREDNQYLKELVKIQKEVTHGTIFTKSSVEAAARVLKKYANAKGDTAVLAGLLQDFYGYIANGKATTWDDISDKAKRVVNWLITHENGGQGGLDYAFAYDMREQELTSKVYDTYWDVSTLYTVADRKQKVINELKYKHKKKMAEVRESHEKKQEALITKHKEYVAKTRDNAEKRQLRTKIQRTVNELDHLLRNPTKKKHIKEGERDFVASSMALANVLFENNISNEDIVRLGVESVTEKESKALNRYRDLLEKIDSLKGKMDAIHRNAIVKETFDQDIDALRKEIDKIKRDIPTLNRELADVFERERARLNKSTMDTIMKDLIEEYAALEKNKDSYIANAFNETIKSRLEVLKETLSGTVVRDMDIYQLQETYDMFKAVVHTIRNSNKAFTEGVKETIRQMAEAVDDQVRIVAKKDKNGELLTERLSVFVGARKLGMNLLKPLTAFKLFGSKTFEKLFRNVQKGEGVWEINVYEAAEFLKAQKEKYGYDSWDLKKRTDFTVKNGDTLSLTLGQMMTLYAYSRRKQAVKHITVGGLVFDDAVKVKKEKNKEGKSILSYEVTTKETYGLTEEMLEEIKNALTKEQLAFVSELQKYLSETMGAKGNEVSMKLLGVKLFKEEFYLPIRSSDYYQNFKPAEAGEVKLRNSSFSKETTPNANNPIVLYDFLDLWAEHVNDMSLYHALVLPLEDFMRVYNYRTVVDAENGEKEKAIKSTLESAFPGAKDYINKWLTDINGGIRSETVGALEKLMSNAKKTAVLASASVAIQQPSAIIRAMAMVSPRYFGGRSLESFNLLKHKKKWEELERYSTTAGIKKMGRFDVGMGQSTKDIIKGDSGVMDKVENALSIPPAYMDEVTWLAIWQAVKRETAAKNPSLATNTKEFLRLAGERFDDVILQTQVYDSVFSRSQLMRNKSFAAKAMTAFMAEPTTSLNMMIIAYIEAGRTQGTWGKVKTFSKPGAAIAGSIILNSVLKAIVMAFRDDDEEESWIESYFEHFAGGIVDGFNPLTYIPLVKDIWSIFQGYDVNRMDMDSFVDLYNAIRSFDGESYEGWANLIGSLANLFGIPAKNLERDIRAVIETVLGESESTTKQGILNALKKGIQDALWEGVDFAEKKDRQQMYEAIIEGDTEHLERIKGRYDGDDKAIEKDLRLALRENDPRIVEAARLHLEGDVDKRVSIAKEIIAEGKFSQDLVVTAISAEINAFKSNITKADKAKDDGNMKEYNKIVKDLLKSYPRELVEKHLSDKSLDVDKEEEQELVTSVYSTEDINIALGNGEVDLAKKVIDDIVATKVANNKKDINQEEKEKKAKASVKSSVTSYWKPLYKEAYASKNYTETARIRKLLHSSGLYGTANDVVETCRNWLKN